MSDDKRGDPTGRRLAREKASLLGEAALVGKSLDVLLQRAGVDPTTLRQFLEDINRKERVELQKAYGRIEPRKRFKKNTGQPLLVHRPTNWLYLDESGVSNPEPRLGPPRFFALGGVAMTDGAAKAYRDKADSIKETFFGRKDITFHEPLMRNREGIYYFNGDLKKQSEFDQAINQMVVESDFVVFGTGVRKTAFEKEFVESGIDPYLPTDAYSVAIVMLLERYVDYLAHSPESQMGRVTFESQGPREDAEHQLEYARVLVDGTQWVSETAFRNWLEPGLLFRPKSNSDPAELADMVARDLFEWIRNGCTGTPGRWDVIGRKIYWRGDGQMGKFGVKVFPDSDIKELIDQHRKVCMGPGN